ncbi:Vacuolar ATPase assembly integral membrane protein VMA21 [Tolypocladium paradoxum]|uniref:Vacuolar ATPase assembly integral membrane protein VMA21 n=1 Tax=Tolypocladium paradoxum TaxID=94208 RepID=A0A2S4KN59_9HYPO|nr:Vacuolar ATPase assembly integral membrane protein VMA21 [Tolypocladium paradoxum]
MATRRIISSEKTILEKDDRTEEKSNISPAVPKHVIFKLLGFTFAMIVLPIGSYFLTVNTVFKGNSSYAGAMAALLANVVLIAYVIVAMNEDESERNSTSKSESKKDR